MSEELLYTQEDIDEWMRACDELQVRLRELEDAIKVKDMLIEQLENQNDRLIEQRDTQEQQLAIYKRALELACGVIRQYVQIVFNDNVDRLKGLTNLEDYYLQNAKYGVYKGETHQIYEAPLDQAKKELEEEDVKN